MGRRPAAKGREAASPEARAPMVPVQKRSRERFERILQCAAAVMAEKGGEAFRMSDIVERTGIPFGSLYQYFPDKTAIIGTLAERYNAIGRACVARDLATVETIADLRPALGHIVDSYYRMFMDEPVMRDIWQATQADRALQKLDEEDGAFLANLLAEAVRPVAEGASAAAIERYAQLMMTLIAAAVRHAITLPPAEGRRVLALFKQLLPADLAALATQ
ncbi:TetR family transcriptional regulator [Sphingomonas sp. IBVSS2]|uniref:TetR/AcrR family transcriptional regulator n=1 Tax=Sphingomonas sp. IBVSS2 TaxID=1985172 RepID=UPI000A2D10DD|nr:TetR/AcrR family transcriptional regulator [Sphingomonas sp. IBVSS2]OSZ68330.1 TetR family transcriptional regulator [Sphingomonas sp. IBVSS2]